MEAMPTTLSQFDEKRAVFQLFFLKDDTDQSVEVEEVENVDFEKVRKHLLKGESVFIACKSSIDSNKLDMSKKRRAMRVTRKHGCASRNVSFLSPLNKKILS